MTDGVPAPEYHEQTKHSPASVRSGPGLDFENKPTPYEVYSDLPAVALPGDPRGPATPALEAIAVDGPDPPEDESVEDRERAQIDRDDLARLCHYAAGVTKTLRRGEREVAFRAAACTGALYHVDLYPVCGDLPGLDAGVYHFDPPSGSLDVLREGDFRGVLAAASGRDRVAGAPLTFVATSTWWRNAWKYRERTFRHAFWDSGTVVANLVAVAHALCLPASAVLGYADRPVADLLGIDPTEEAPLELIPVGAGAPVPEAPTVEPIDPETRPLSPDPQDYPLIHRAWAAGALPDGERAEGWRERAGERAPVGTREPGDGDRVPLDRADREDAPDPPLGRTIRRRGSCREYARRPVGFGEVSTVLDRAFRGAPLDVRPPDRSGDGSAGSPQGDGSPTPPLAFNDAYLIANGVAGLPAGVYHYHPAAGELERLRAGEFRREAGHLALDQRLGADAAVCLYFATDVEAIAAALGDRGYRAAQFEAALTAGRCYLATYAHDDLGGTGLTFYDDAVTELLSPRAAGQTPTFLYTLGRPA